MLHQGRGALSPHRSWLMEESGSCLVSFVAPLMLKLSESPNLVAQGASLWPANVSLVVRWLIVTDFAVIKLKKSDFKNQTKQPEKSLKRGSKLTSLMGVLLLKQIIQEGASSSKDFFFFYHSLQPLVLPFLVEVWALERRRPLSPVFWES